MVSMFLFLVSVAGCSTFSLNHAIARKILLWFGWPEDLGVAVNWLCFMKMAPSKLTTTCLWCGTSMVGTRWPNFKFLFLFWCATNYNGWGLKVSFFVNECMYCKQLWNIIHTSSECILLFELTACHAAAIPYGDV